MRGLCHTLEDAHTAVVQAEGRSCIIRMTLPSNLGDEVYSLALRATAQKPVPVEFEVGDWDVETGVFNGTAMRARS